MRRRFRNLGMAMMVAVCILLTGCGKSQQQSYEEALEAYNLANYSTALDLFTDLKDYEDATAYTEQCNYKLAYLMLQDGKVSEAENYMKNVTSVELKTELEGQYQKNLAVAAMENGNYEEALRCLEQVEEYSLKSEYLYQIAEHYIEKLQFALGQQAIDQIAIHSSEDAGELQMKMKYAMYVHDPFWKADDYVVAHEFISAEDMEESVSLFYGTWYNHDDGSTVEITENTIAGRPYAVHTTYTDYMTYIMVYFYTDEPEVLYGMGLESYSFMLDEVTYENISGIIDYPWFVEGLESSGIYGYSVDEARYDELYAADMEYWESSLGNLFYSEEPSYSSDEGNYSKYTVYSAAKDEFQSWLNSKYSMTEQLYMSINYQTADAATFSYNSAMDSYQIRFEVTVNANIFDFFGTSTSTYVVQAEYYESGSGLKASMFNVY